MSEHTKPHFSQGDEITIMRGLDRGKTAKVLDVDEAKQQYAVKLTEGGLAVVNFVNVRVPDEAGITASQIGPVLTSYRIDLPDSFLGDLEKVAPGITAQMRVAEVQA